jgi:hypothetical protein
MLEHLVVYPISGLCNRMRAIASAKRLCARAGARCTILWDWGDYRALFDDDTEWIPHTAEMDWRRDRLVPGYHHIRHLAPAEGGSRRTWRVPVTTYSRIAVTSRFVFCAAEERLLRRYTVYEEQDVMPWFPRPAAAITREVEAFKEACFVPHTAGIHIRRTDNVSATLRSPDSSYFKHGDRLVDSGHRLFLATDNQATLDSLRRRYGQNLIHYQKQSDLRRRWPRTSSTEREIIDDLIDLCLLASCEFVIGSQGSSFSRVAILLNGSRRCKAIDHPLGTLHYAVRRLQMLGRRLSDRHRHRAVGA